MTVLIPGIKTRRTWLARERDYLRRHYGRAAPEPMTARAIAAVLGCAIVAVYAAALRFGLRRRLRRITPVLDARLRDLHAQGQPCARIARILCVSSGTCWAWHRRLGLTANGLDAESRRVMRRKFLARLSAEWGHNPGHAEAVRRAVAAALAGWVGAGCPSEVAALDYLRGAGPSTRAEIASATGRPLCTAHHLLTRLRRRGLVTATPTRPVLWSIAPPLTPEET